MGLSFTSNLETRYLVLDSSLHIEDSLSTLLVKRFEIKRQSETLGNKASSLSFKLKIDFLYDLELIDKKEKNNLIFFSNIRNQFLHNLTCRSFLDFALTPVGNSTQSQWEGIKLSIDDEVKNEKYFISRFEILVTDIFERLTNINTQIEMEMIRSNPDYTTRIVNEINTLIINHTLKECEKITPSVFTAEALKIFAEAYINNFNNQKDILKIEQMPIEPLRNFMRNEIKKRNEKLGL